MTIGEKRAAIENHCRGRSCANCALLDVAKYDTSCYSKITDEKIERNYAILCGKTPDVTASAIEHPSHYAGEKYECIEVMREVFGDEVVTAFCLGNSFKYLWRCKKKHDNAVTDLKKARFYIEEYIKLEEGEKENGEQQTESSAEGA